MRILQVTPMYYPELQFGGPPQKIHALSRGLVERGHQVRVITIQSTHPLACHSQVMDGVEVQYMPWVGVGRWCVPFCANKLASAIRQADIVHGYGLYNFLCPDAAFWARRMQRPFVLEPLGMYPAQGRNVHIKTAYHRLFTAPMAHGDCSLARRNKTALRTGRCRALGAAPQWDRCGVFSELTLGGGVSRALPHS